MAGDIFDEVGEKFRRLCRAEGGSISEVEVGDGVKRLDCTFRVPKGAVVLGHDTWVNVEVGSSVLNLDAFEGYKIDVRGNEPMVAEVVVAKREMEDLKMSKSVWGLSMLLDRKRNTVHVVL